MELSRLIGFDAQLLSESFWTAFNIFVLFFGLSYLLFNPVRNVLEKRKQKIAGELADAAQDKEAAADCWAALLGGSQQSLVWGFEIYGAQATATTQSNTEYPACTAL